MSRTKLILDVVEDLRSLADSLQAVADVMVSGEVPQSPVQPVPDPVSQVPAPAEPPKPAITLEQVRTVLAEKSRAGFTAEVRTLLQKYGASKLSSVDPKDYQALLHDAEVLSDGT